MRLLLLFFLLPLKCFSQIQINGVGTRVNINSGSAGDISFINVSNQNPNNSSNTTSAQQQIFVLVGNSIVAGRSSEWGPRPVNATVYEWNGSAMVMIANTDISTANIGSPWPQLGIDYNSQMSRRIYFSASGLSGAYFAPTTGDNGNNWSSTGNLYAPMVTKANAALANLGVQKPRGIMLELGINDSRSSTDLSIVQASVISLFDRMETDFPGTRIYVTNIGRHQTAISDARIDAIRGYITTEINARANVYEAYDLRIFANDFPQYYSSDSIHLNQNGNNVWGGIMADYLIYN